tara:strand:+ start:6313 stop:6810 length:498 start_codon:yes stop_codon:yes gene_type:complete
MKTLQESREAWSNAIEGDGGYCPCCDRWGKIYPRHFNSSMARALLWLVREGADWTDVPNTAPKWLTRTNQLPTVRWWGLIERQESDDPTVKHSGVWRPTERGSNFAHGRTTIPRVVFTYNAQVVRFGEEKMRVEEAFKTQFDYAQVMLPVSRSLQMEMWDDEKES